MTYSEQLKHPKWQKRRLEMLSMAGWACRSCKDTSTTLHVHHKQYFKGRMAWEYSNDELEVLCDPCHDFAHAALDRLKGILALLPSYGPGSAAEATDLLLGWSGRGDQSGTFHERIGIVAQLAELILGDDQIDRIFEICGADESTPDGALLLRFLAELSNG